MAEQNKVGVQIKVAKDQFIGTVLDGRYEILERVGSGAMGSLYRGKHLALDRPVAIKFLHAHLASDETHMERFVREAKLAGSLQHANVAHVYDVGNAQDGSPYLVMDYLDGRSLQAIVTDLGAMPERRALPLILQIAQGLAYAHSKGLLHRDLKLTNVMVVNDGAQETAKIIDFGIAKSMTEDDASRLTQTGEVFGSPLYMSPEQCQGHQLDERSDLYSFGCVIYEMLTGVPPLRGNDLISTVYKHINEPPRPFAEAAPAAKVSPELEALVMRLLRKQPADRYQKSAEVVDAVQKLVSSCPTPATDVSPDQTVVSRAASSEPLVPSADLANRGKAQFALIMGACLLIGGGATAYFMTHPPTPPAPAPTTQKVNAQGVPIVAEYVIDGKPYQFVKDDYLGDDDPIVWKNDEAANQPVEVLMAYTHQSSKHPRSFDIQYDVTGDVDVKVGPQHKKDVVLVLGAFAPINWHVKAAPGVKVKQVILSGYLQQAVDGIGKDVKVVETSDDLRPDRKTRPEESKPFKPFSGIDNISRGEDVAKNSYMTDARETIKKLTNGNDVNELRVTNQTHQVDF
jgi:serine/threonine protein kinase